MGILGDIYLSVYSDSTTDEPTLLDAFGRSLSYNTIELSRMDRTANGSLNRDIIADKMKIKLSYGEIDGNSLLEYKNFYDLKEELLLTIFTDQPSPEEYVVLMSPFNWKRYRLFGENGSLFKNVTIEFLEV